MCPGHSQQKKLHPDHVGAAGPISEQHYRIVRWIAPKQQAAQSHDPQMTCDQQRNTQPQYQLGDFNDRVAKMPALVERPQSQKKMCGCSGIKRKIDYRYSPPPDMEAKPRLHGVVGEIAECVIEEMRKYVGEHDEAANQPHLANADPAQPRREA